MTPAAVAPVHRHARRDGVARLADPKITLASVSSLVLGSAAAARHGGLDWGWLALTVAGIFCVETAKNASGEIVDFASGADLAVTPEDRSPFSGGKRVIVDGLLSVRETAVVAAVFYAAAAAAGLWIVAARDTRVLGLGVAGIALAFFYHASPLRLAYRGLGELAVAFAYGPLVAFGTYLVQRGTLADPPLAVLAIGLGALVSAFLVANEFPDARADEASGKRTLVVRLGGERAVRLFGALQAAGFAAVAMAPAWGAPLHVWLGFAGVPFGFAAWRRLTNEWRVTRRVVAAQAWALAAFVFMALGAAVGLVQ
jgi:1,4-dihydroxy-2-naphthoate polyprenyltransferase